MTEAAGGGDGGAATMHMKYKIVFLGDPNVGKTSIILRFTQDTFDGNYQVSHYATSLSVSITLNREML
jgi:GTPase SAR1 family protein